MIDMKIISRDKKIIKTLILSFAITLALSGILFSYHIFAESSDTGQQLQTQVLDAKNGASAIVTIVSDDGVYESSVLLNELAVKNDIDVTVAGETVRKLDNSEVL